MGFCDACGNDVAKTQQCSGCKSRTYCGAACQKADWRAGHRGQCKALKAARAELAGGGAKVKSGMHPEMGRRNMHTGQGPKKMRPPESAPHQEANVRQMLSQMLGSANKATSMYSSFAFSLNEAMGGAAPWPALQAELRMMQEGGGMSGVEARVLLDYREGAFMVGKAEVQHLGPTPLDARSLPRDPGTSTLLLLPGAQMGGGEGGEGGGAATMLKDAAMRALSARCSQLAVARLQYQHQLTAAPLLGLVQANPRLRTLDLTGCAYAVDDAVLRALGRGCCRELASLAFGCDNLNLQPLDVTSEGLQACARGCPKLRVLRVLHRTRSGDPSDPDGAVARALQACGLRLRCCAGAEFFCASLKDDAHQFWRATVESGTTSACWFERAPTAATEAEVGVGEVD